MSISMRRSLAAAVLSTAVLAGCSSNSEDNTFAKTSEMDLKADPIQITQIFEGQITLEMESGAAEMVIPSARWSGDYDLSCIVLEGYNDSPSLSCDFK